MKNPTRKGSHSTSNPAFRIGLLLVILAILCPLILKLGRESPSASSAPALPTGSEAKALASSSGNAQSLASPPPAPTETPRATTPPSPQVVEATGIIEGRLGQVPPGTPEADAHPRMPPAPPPSPALPLPPGAKIVTTRIPLHPSTPPGEPNNQTPELSQPPQP